jgi:hypothetical protein
MHRLLSEIDLFNIWFEGLFAAAVSLYAWVKGGRAARAAGVINALAWPVGTVTKMIIEPVALQLAIACTQDALVAVGLLYLSFRYNSLWLGVGVIAQGLQLALDYVYVSQRAEFAQLNRFMLGAVLNGLTYVILISILGAAVAERRRLALQGPVRV